MLSVNDEAASGRRKRASVLAWADMVLITNMHHTGTVQARRWYDTAVIPLRGVSLYYPHSS